MRVSARLSRGTIEAAELAIDIANVRRVEMPVHIEVRVPAVLLPAHEIGQFTQRGQIVGREKCQPICEREPLAASDFGREVIELRVV